MEEGPGETSLRAFFDFDLLRASFRVFRVIRGSLLVFEQELDPRTTKHHGISRTGRAGRGSFDVDRRNNIRRAARAGRWQIVL